MKRRRSRWDKRSQDREERVGPTPEMLAKPLEARDPVWAMVQNGKRRPKKAPWLTSQQEWCVEEFRRLFRAFVAMRTSPRGTMDPGAGFGGDGDGDPEAAAAYRQAVTAITRAGGRQTFDALVNVAIFRRWPHRSEAKFMVAVGVLEERWAGKRRAA